MTPRERVLATLNHREPDTVAIDFSGHRSSGISAMAYGGICGNVCNSRPADPGLRPDSANGHRRRGRARPVWDRHDRTRPGICHRGRYWYDWVLPDGSPCQMPVWVKPERDGNRWILRSKSGRVIAQMPDGAFISNNCTTHSPMGRRTTPGSRKRSTRPCGRGSLLLPARNRGPEGGKAFIAGAKRLQARTNRAIIGLFGGNLLETGQFFYRNDNFFVLMASDPDATHDFLDRLVEIHLKNLERFLSAVGPFIDVVLFGDDLGMQTGPQISPEMYREFFKPRHALMWKRAKELANVKVMLHCCGGVRELLPDLIDAGLDAINPVQILLPRHGCRRIKARFWLDIVLWGGGCDTQTCFRRAHRSRYAGMFASRSRFWPGRRIRLSAGTQHPGPRSAGEHCGHVRRRARGLTHRPLHVVFCPTR